MFVKVAEHIKEDQDLFSFSFQGKVVDNNDPDKLGRIKVEVPNVYQGDKSLFPWVHRKESGNNGEFSVPPLNTIVEISFPDRDLYNPTYCGRYLKAGKIDSVFEEDYPNTYGYVDDAGNKFTANKTSKLVKYEHSSGHTHSLSDSGEEHGITGDLKVTATGEAEFFGTAKTTVGSSASQTIVNGQLVNLGGVGGTPVAVVGSQSVGTGNAGAPVVSTIMDGSSKVSAVR